MAAIPAFAAPAPAPALDGGGEVLRIAMAGPVTSLDPHYHAYTPNLTVAEHLYDALVRRDSALRLLPALAEAWSELPTGGWELHLRPGVTFSDGTPFTAADVVATFARVRGKADSPGTLAGNLKAVERVEVVDPLTIRLHTAGPSPTLMRELATIAILPAAGTELPTRTFDSGALPPGTGPYRLSDPGPLLREVPGNHRPLVLRARPDAWAGPPPWERVELWQQPDDARRLAGMLAGAYEVMERVPPADARRLAANPSLRLVSGPSTRVLMLVPDIARARSPHIFALDGAPLAVNPLADLRVRRAVSLAIDRDALIAQELAGLGRAANQPVPQDMEGAADLPPIPHDLATARMLLVEAGWAEGFALTLHTPRDRYTADVAVAQAVGRMLDRIGIRVAVEAVAPETFFPQANARAYSLFLTGLSSDSGEAAHSLRSLLGSRPGAGALNRGGWSDDAFDALLAAAEVEPDLAVRTSLLDRAGRLAAEAVAVIPLHVQEAVWALRHDLTMPARADERTLAVHVRHATP